MIGFRYRPRSGTSTPGEEAAWAPLSTLTPSQYRGSNLPLAAETALLVILLPVFIMLLTSTRYQQQVALLTLASVVAVVGYNFTLGYLGHFNLGHAAIIGTGAYAYGSALLHGFSTPVAITGAIVAGVVVALVLAKLSETVGDIYFAMASFAVTLVMQQAFLNGGSLTGGAFGLRVEGARLGAGYVWFFAVVAGSSVVIARRLEQSQFGRQWVTIRRDAVGASALGTNVSSRIRIAYLCSGVYGALGGVMYATAVRYLGPDNFSVGRVIEQVTMLLVGGAGNAFGAVMGAVTLGIATEALRPLGENRLMAYGILLILVLLTAPGGLWSLVWRLRPSKRKHRGPSFLESVSSSPVAFEEDTEVAQRTDVSLQVEGVHLRFGALRVLNGISAAFEGGKVHALVGPNGCGKSSLINVISGIYEADEGAVQVSYGQPEEVVALTKLSIADRANVGIGRSFQDLFICPELTVAETMLGSAELMSEQTGSRHSPTSVVTEWVSALALSERAGWEMGQLSGGWQRRVELVKTAIIGSKILLLDEPLVGLAPSVRDEAIALVRRLADEGRCVIVVEHDLESLWQVADEAFVMVDGAIVARGTVAEVRDSKTLREALLGGTPSRPDVRATVRKEEI